MRYNSFNNSFNDSFNDSFNNGFNNSFNHSFSNIFTSPQHNSNLKPPIKPQIKKKLIPEITNCYGVDKQAEKLSKLFYNSQQNLIQKCQYRSELSFLYISTFNYWCPLEIKDNINLQRHFSQILFALSRSLKVLKVLKGHRLIHYKLPKKNDIILCKYILRMKQTSDKYVWIPTKIINIDKFGNAEISFNNNYTGKDVFRKTKIQNNDYLKEWKWIRSQGV